MASMQCFLVFMGYLNKAWDSRPLQSDFIFHALVLWLGEGPSFKFFLLDNIFIITADLLSFLINIQAGV